MSMKVTERSTMNEASTATSEEEIVDVDRIEVADKTSYTSETSTSDCLRKDLHVERKAKAALEDDLRRAKREQAKTREALKKLQKEKDFFSKALKNEQAQKNSLRMELECTKTQLTELKRAERHSQRLMKKQTSDLEKDEEVIKNLTKELQSVLELKEELLKQKKKYCEKNKEVQSLHSTNNNLHGDIEAKDKIILTLQEKETQRASELREEQAKNDKLKADHQILVHKLQKDQENTVEKLRWDHEATVNKLQKDREAALEKLRSDTETSVEKLQRDHDVLVQRLHRDHEVAIDKLQRDHEVTTDKLQRDYAAASAQQQNDKRERDRLTAELKEAQLRNCTVEQQHQEAEETCRKLEEEVKKERARFMRVGKAIQGQKITSEAIEGIKCDMEELRMETRSMRDQFASLAAKYDFHFGGGAPHPTENGTRHTNGHDEPQREERVHKTAAALEREKERANETSVAGQSTFAFAKERERADQSSCTLEKERERDRDRAYQSTADLEREWASCKKYYNELNDVLAQNKKTLEEQHASAQVLQEAQAAMCCPTPEQMKHQSAYNIELKDKEQRLALAQATDALHKLHMEHTDLRRKYGEYNSSISEQFKANSTSSTLPKSNDKFSYLKGNPRPDLRRTSYTPIQKTPFSSHLPDPKPSPTLNSYKWKSNTFTPSIPSKAPFGTTRFEQASEGRDEAQKYRPCPFSMYKTPTFTQ